MIFLPIYYVSIKVDVMKKVKMLVSVLMACTVICITVITITNLRWGDIWEIRDLANLIGWANINHVICAENCIDLELDCSSYQQNLSEVEKIECLKNPIKYIQSHLEKINCFLNNNEYYKDKKVTVQYGSRPDDGGIGRNPVITFRNFSFNYQMNYKSDFKVKTERYDGFYAMFLDGGYTVDLDDFSQSPWNNMKELIFYNYYLPDNPKAIENLTSLEYLCFNEIIDDESYNELCKYAPWCEIKNGS